MRRTPRARSLCSFALTPVLASGLLLAAAGCGDTEGDPDTAAGDGGSPLSTGGGGATTGGAPTTGGISATGGFAATGGLEATGGFAPTGGSLATGGAPTTGGLAATGGFPATGGDATTGGSAATGGASTGGVTTGGGGTATGGEATGGLGTGGGGAPTGGVSTGGVSTGGVTTGGVTTGGASTGGVSTGGDASGGTTTGGQATTPCDFSSLTEYEGNGSVTFYDPSGVVNCSFPMSGSNVTHVATGGGAHIVALGPADYQGSGTCGACIEVSRDDGRSVVVTVVDQCPGCQAGHIDLSRAAFLELGTETEGYLGTGNGGAVGIISWRYVACPVAGDVTIALKEPTNPGWNEFMVEDARLPIATFAANWNGTWVTGTRQTYNYFNVGGSLSFPVQIQLTDVAGNVIQGTVQAGQAEQSLGAQFPACL